MKYLIKLHEVPLINLLREEDLKKLNSLFETHYRPLKIEITARIIGQIRHEDINAGINDEIDRLMRTKPVKGGWHDV